MGLKKNDIIQISITDMAQDAQGVGRYEGFTLFVKDALPGDTVRAVVTKVNRGYGFAKTLEVTEPSEFRVTAPCAAAKRCGGCQIMELDYGRQLELKETKLLNSLVRIGKLNPGDFETEPVIGMTQEDFAYAGPEKCTNNFVQNKQKTQNAKASFCPLHYRNKVQFPVGLSADGHVIAGFYAGRTHYIVETEGCPAAFEEAGILIKAVCGFTEKNGLSVYDEKTGRGLVRHVLLRKGFSTGRIMVCLVVNSASFAAGGKTGDGAAFEALPEFLCTTAGLNIASVCINFNNKKTNVILGEKTVTIYGDPYIEDKISGLTFRISAQSFFQVNPVQAEKLYAKVLEYAALTGKETVWDLYCGIGTISLLLAEKAGKVFGVEIVPQAIEDAKENAALNGIGNVRFFCGKSEEVFPEFYKKAAHAERPGAEGNETAAGRSGANEPAAAGPQKADVVVLDPPRKGCGAALLSAVLETEPARIVYVSCNPATLARDINILSGKYVLEKAAACDMFPHTNHCEAVTCLVRRKDVP